jgi:hypothetical protein
MFTVESHTARMTGAFWFIVTEDNNGVKVHDTLFHDAHDDATAEANRLNEEKLAKLEAAFEEAGGRGVELAEEIDQLRQHIEILEIEAEHGQKIVAVIYNEDGTVYDHAFNWETAQNMALSEGYTVKAIADDPQSPSMTKDKIQALCDAEKERHDDCFGRSN